MALNGFTELFLWLEQWGLADALLPFLLIFTLVFATLQRTGIVGDGKKQFNVIIAFVMAFIVVVPHITGQYPAGKDVVTIINTAIPNVSLVLVAIVTILLLIGLFSPAALAGTALGGVFALISVIAVVFFFGQAAGVWGDLPPMLGFLNDSDTQALLIIILVFGVVLWFITRDDGGGANVGGGLGKFMNMFRDAITPK